MTLARRQVALVIIALLSTQILIIFYILNEPTPFRLVAQTDGIVNSICVYFMLPISKQIWELITCKHCVIAKVAIKGYCGRCLERYKIKQNPRPPARRTGRETLPKPMESTLKGSGEMLKGVNLPASSGENKIASSGSVTMVTLQLSKHRSLAEMCKTESNTEVSS